MDEWLHCAVVCAVDRKGAKFRSCYGASSLISVQMEKEVLMEHTSFFFGIKKKKSSSKRVCHYAIKHVPFLVVLLLTIHLHLLS